MFEPEENERETMPLFLSVFDFVEFFPNSLKSLACHQHSEFLISFFPYKTVLADRDLP